MDNLAGVSAFVQAAEALSFVEAGRLLGVSASAIGKSVARLEARLGVRLFHRSTRSMTLTAEGRLFLQRCQRILGEMAAAEQELSDTRSAPRGKLRVSLPWSADCSTRCWRRLFVDIPKLNLNWTFPTVVLR